MRRSNKSHETSSPVAVVPEADTTSRSCSPEKDGGLPNHSRRQSTIARRACDFCRVRRRRCVFGQAQAETGAGTGTGTGTATATGMERCRECIRLDLVCTFLKPTQTRGPKRRKIGLTIMQRDIHSSSQSFESPSTRQVDTAASGPWFATEKIGPRGLILVIIDDYLARIYPLIPVVHRPTFRRRLNQSDDDPDFLALILSLVVVAVGLLPSRFPYYQSLTSGSLSTCKFQTRESVINACIDLCMEMRTATYWDQVSHQKWATSYLLSVGCFQLGQANRSRMLEVEFLQTGRLLGIHRIADYEGLNCIETQLRKKAFWLCFYTYAHAWYQCGRQERLSFFDHGMLAEVNFDALVPLELDDEQILEHKLLESPISPPAAISPAAASMHQYHSRTAAKFNLTAGFNLHSRVFHKSAQLALTPALCDWERRVKPTDRLSHLRQLLQEMRYMLDDAPLEIRQWASSSWFPDEVSIASPASVQQDSSVSYQADEMVEDDAKSLPGQFEIMRANLHGTHLWLQSALLDQIDLILQDMSKRPDISQSERDCHLAALKASWSEREDVCRQILHLVHSIPHAYIEPNGLYFAYKVRDVGVALLNCPFEASEPPARRATEYMRDLTRALSRIDQSERMNTSSLRSWVDTDREQTIPRGYN
ncbi:unnamed protein product [Clonostachys byssicola]|uniref:Zn(2)-C6 fungal-type domain-containing protein n=1 Tax=Clonostachys byssicola TaxID=160290 RepID=A0A9N9UGD0_9HYPO|nr:unnamed protein product [Clonostachys byssicola]